MNLATNLFIVYIIYFILMYIKLVFNKSARNEHKQTRIDLERLRNIPVKTQEQQREFLDLKYPKKDSFKWTFKNITLFILKLALMAGVFIGTRYLWRTYIVWEFALWQVLIIVIIVPIILNKILKKFNLQHDDLLVYFR